MMRTTNFFGLRRSRLWAATRQDEDLKVLRTASVPEELAGRISHQTAGPRGPASNSGYDCESCTYELQRVLVAVRSLPMGTGAHEELDRFLGNRSKQAKRVWPEFCTRTGLQANSLYDYRLRMPNGFSSNTGITSASHTTLFKLRCMLRQSLFWRLHPPRIKDCPTPPDL